MPLKKGQHSRSIEPTVMALAAQGLNQSQIHREILKLGHQTSRQTVMRILKRQQGPKVPAKVEHAMRALRVSRDLVPAVDWLDHLSRTLENLHRMEKLDDAVGLAACQTAGELSLAAAEFVADRVEEEVGASG